MATRRSVTMLSVATKMASRLAASRRVANRHAPSRRVDRVRHQGDLVVCVAACSREVLFPRLGIRPLLVTYGHFWSLNVILGHFLPFLPRGLGFATQLGGLWGAFCAPSQPAACLARPCLRSPGWCRERSPLYLATWRPPTSPSRTRLLET